MKKTSNTSRPFFTKESYAVYLRGEHWKRKRHEFLTTDKRTLRNKRKYGQYVCHSCKSPEGLNVHHKTYDRVGNEDLEDLMLVCRSCHQRIHLKPKKRGAKSIHINTYKVLHENWKNSERGKAYLERRRLRKLKIKRSV